MENLNQISNKTENEYYIAKVNRVKEILYFKNNSFKSFIKETIDDTNQFRRNIFYGELCELINKVINIIERHDSYINTKVHPLINSHGYVKKADADTRTFLNPIGEEVDFTEKMFFVFVKKHIDFLIDYLTKQILSNVTFSSTSKLSNISGEIRNEATVEMISLLKELKELLK